MSEVNATFNSYDLQTSSVVSSGIVHENTPHREIVTEDRPRQERIYIVDTYWKSRTIKVLGTIIQSSQSDADTELDDLKENLIGTEQNLDIDYAGGTRRYKATVKSIKSNREHYHISHLPYEIEFFCADPFGYATSSTNHSDDDITSSPHTSSVTIAGSYNPLPTITMTVDSETDMTVIKFENTTTGDEIQVSRSFADAEVLEIDCDEMTVEVDDTAVDYSGGFPEFEPNSNSYKITVTDSGAFNIDLDIDYTATYL